MSDNFAIATPAIHGRKRLFTVLAGLYLAQAIPSYLFAAALPPIMREAGVSRTAIGVGMLGSLLISTQDIATDGYAAKHLAPEDRAIGNAIQGGSVAFGVVIGGTLGLVLYSRIGWTGMLLTIAGFCFIPLAAAFAMREKDPAPTGGQAIDRPSLKAFFRRREVRDVLWGRADLPDERRPG